MPTDTLDQLIKSCSAELNAIVWVLEQLRSDRLRITQTREDIKRFELRATNLRKTIRQLRAHKIAADVAKAG